MDKLANLVALQEQQRRLVQQIYVRETLLWIGMQEAEQLKDEEEDDFERFLISLQEYDHKHVAKKLKDEEEDALESFLISLQENDHKHVTKQLKGTEREVSVLPGNHNEGNYHETAAVRVLNDGPLARVINPIKVYDIDTEAKGRVLIINYTKTIASTGQILYRDGSQHDVEKMRSMFREIGFNEADVFQDLNRGNLITTLRDFARSANYDNTKSVFVLIMAHGGNHQNGHYICTQEGDGIFIEEEIRQIFDSKEVPNLAKRPKIFIIQACRGEKDDVGEFVEPAKFETDADGVQPRERVKVPSFSDYLFAFSTQPNHVSYRDTATGSPYLQELDHVFREESHTMHVADMLTVVRNNFIRSQERRTFIQSPEMLSGLNKFFYIYPESL